MAETRSVQVAGAADMSGVAGPKRLEDLRALKLWSGLTSSEFNRAQHRASWPHASPDSVFVGFIGGMYDPSCWQKGVDMVMHTQTQGLKCWFEEIVPMRGGAVPLVDLAYMRDMTVLRALEGGFEWACLLDGDTLPQADTLTRLIADDVSIVAPLIVEPGIGSVIGDPIRKPGQGLVPMRWVCMSLLLMRTSIFNCPNAGFMFNGGGAADSVFFQRLWHYGHRPYMDTTLEVQVTRPPGRLGKYTWDERWAILKAKYEQSQERPDRRPIDPNDPNCVEGVYAPYLVRAGGLNTPLVGSQNGNGRKE